MAFPWALGLYFLVVYVVMRAIRYVLYDCAPVRLQHQLTPRNQLILQRMRTLPGRFYPTPYMVNNVLQTVYVLLGRRPPPDPCHHDMLEVEPGEKVMLTWLEAEGQFEADSALPIVIVLHGIDGNATLAYARHMARVMREQGWRAVLPTRRGCNPAIPNQRSYEYQDPDFCLVVQYVGQRYPNARLYAVGMSAGANIVAKYAGMTGSECRLSGVVSLCNGFDWDKGSRVLSQKWFWNHCILHSARKQFYYKNEQVYTDPNSPLHGRVCPVAIKKTRSFREFDEAFQVPLHQYNSLEEYYAAQSCIHDLPGIAIPALFLQAEDDRISAPELTPFRRLYNNEHCILAVSHRGGHVGWAQGWWPFGVRATNWAEDVTADFFRVLISL